MRKKIKVSVLIPVYNTEKYLRKCLDSVLGQTLSEIEIIITNDGSTDNSEKIIIDYMKKDNRIIYDKQKNSGLGATRNKGIERANGEYIVFLDSDDWVEKDCYEQMYKLAIEKNADLITCNYFINTLNSQIEYKHIYKNKEEYIKKCLKREISGFSWNKLYKKSMIDKNKLRFPLRGECENVEDQFFSVTCAYFANKIINIDKAFVHYIIRDNSIVNKYQKNLIKDGIYLYNYNKKLFDGNSDEIYSDYIDTNLLYHICQSVSNELKVDLTLNYKTRLENIKTIGEYYEISSVIKKYNKRNSLKKNITKETKITLNLLKLKMFRSLYLFKYLRIRYIELKTKK